MDQVFELETPGGHLVLVAAEGRRLLLDTGSPVSFGGGSVELLGNAYALNGELAGFDLGTLSRFVGAPLDGLIGADIFSQVAFTVDLRAGVVVFHSDASGHQGTLVKARQFLGIPIVDLSVAGRPVQVFVDTGAVVSFLAKRQPSLPEPFANRREFLPGLAGFEEFDTPLYRLPVCLGDKEFDAEFGLLPPTVGLALGIVGTEAILGADLSKRFRVLFDLRAERLVLNEHASTLSTGSQPPRTMEAMSIQAPGQVATPARGD